MFSRSCFIHSQRSSVMISKLSKVRTPPIKQALKGIFEVPCSKLRKVATGHLAPLVSTRYSTPRKTPKLVKVPIGRARSSSFVMRKEYIRSGLVASFLLHFPKKKSLRIFDFPLDKHQGISSTYVM